MTELDDLSPVLREMLAVANSYQRLGFDHRAVYFRLGRPGNVDGGPLQIGLAGWHVFVELKQAGRSCIADCGPLDVSAPEEEMPEVWDAMARGALRAWNAASQDARNQLYRSSQHFRRDTVALITTLMAKGIAVPRARKA